MEREEIKEQLKGIVETVLDSGNLELGDDEKTNEIEGWNSLSHVLIVSEIEKKFDVKFKLKELGKMDSIGAIMDLIMNKLQS